MSNRNKKTKAHIKKKCVPSFRAVFLERDEGGKYTQYFEKTHKVIREEKPPFNTLLGVKNSAKKAEVLTFYSESTNNNKIKKVVNEEKTKYKDWSNKKSHYNSDNANDSYCTLEIRDRLSGKSGHFKEVVEKAEAINIHRNRCLTVIPENKEDFIDISKYTDWLIDTVNYTELCPDLQVFAKAENNIKITYINHDLIRRTHTSAEFLKMFSKTLMRLIESDKSDIEALHNEAYCDFLEIEKFEELQNNHCIKERELKENVSVLTASLEDSIKVRNDLVLKEKKHINNSVFYKSNIEQLRSSVGLLRHELNKETKKVNKLEIKAKKSYNHIEYLKKEIKDSGSLSESHLSNILKIEELKNDKHYMQVEIGLLTWELDVIKRDVLKGDYLTLNKKLSNKNLSIVKALRKERIRTAGLKKELAFYKNSRNYSEKNIVEVFNNDDCQKYAEVYVEFCKFQKTEPVKAVMTLINKQEYTNNVIQLFNSRLKERNIACKERLFYKGLSYRSNQPKKISAINLFNEKKSIKNIRSNILKSKEFILKREKRVYEKWSGSRFKPLKYNYIKIINSQLSFRENPITEIKENDYISFWIQNGDEAELKYLKKTKKYKVLKKAVNIYSKVKTTLFMEVNPIKIKKEKIRIKKEVVERNLVLQARRRRKEIKNQHTFIREYVKKFGY